MQSYIRENLYQNKKFPKYKILNTNYQAYIYIKDWIAKNHKIAHKTFS